MIDKDQTGLTETYRMIEALPSEMQEEIKLIVERMHSGYKEKLITQERINHCITKRRYYRLSVRLWRQGRRRTARYLACVRMVVRRRWRGWVR